MNLNHYEDLIVDVLNDGVVRVTINRPERLNALTRTIRRDLIEVFQEVNSDPSASALVLTGAGDRAFAAGQDLEEAKSFSSSSIDEWINEWRELYDCVLAFSKPTVAAVNGYAVGAGFQLALLCDIRVASDKAKFAMPEIDDAIPCITGTWTLYELVGRGRTTDLVISGRTIDADEALNWGVVTHVLTVSELGPASVKLAATLGAKPATAMRLNKRWLRELLMANLPASEAYAKEAHAEAFGGGEPQRIMADFLSRRSTSHSRSW